MRTEAMLARAAHFSPGSPPAAFVPPPMKLSVVGFLLKDAEFRRSATGAYLVAQVQQPLDALPFVAVHHVDLADADILQARAEAMRRHRAVLILGSGIYLDTHDGACVLKLRDVRGIQLVNPAEMFTALDAREAS